MAKKILLTSFKGGTGVTTCCIGLGLALAGSGERTLIIDGDTKSNCAEIMGGCANMQVYTLADYEKGACRAKQTIISHPKVYNLCFMPSAGLSDKSVFSRAANESDGLFDYILFDKTGYEKCDEALIVTEPYIPSVKSADCCRAHLADGGIKNIGLIVNKINGGQIIGGEIMTAQEIATVLQIPLKAVIPEDLTLSSGKQRATTAKAFAMAADAVSGKKQAFCNVLSGYTGLNGYIKRIMRSRV